MIKVSATKLRNKLFDYLDKAAEGETVVIQRNNQEVARLVPIGQINWRDKIKAYTTNLDIPYQAYIKLLLNNGIKKNRSS